MAAQRIVRPGRDAAHRVGDPGAPVEAVPGVAGGVAVGVDQAGALAGRRALRRYRPIRLMIASMTKKIALTPNANNTPAPMFSKVKLFLITA